MRTYEFRSGIRVIRIEAVSLIKASLYLRNIEPTAWTDPTWNWKIRRNGVLIYSGEED